MEETKRRPMTNAERATKRRRRLGIPMGHARPKARKFTPEQVHSVRFGNETNEQAAERLNCSPSSIVRIRRGETYKELPFDPAYKGRAKQRQIATIWENRRKRQNPLANAAYEAYYDV